MRIFYDFLFVIILILLSFHAATTHAALRLNEIYPAPQSGNFEWVELYNDESSSVKISDYTLLDLAANAILLPDTTAPPFGIIVATSSGILNNTGDTVFLKHNGDTVDVATYSGSITADKSFARCPDGTGSWVTTTVISKSSLNTGVCLLVSPSPTSSPTATLFPTPTLVPSSTPTNTPTLVPTSTILSVTPT
ncbi:lamin tail domain-containing protein, partial [Candidatus Roizmanbacteria bacterium]|nr:lamin tail domain-containing protein [Candidatus Roizmanbacteria bacterium]